MAPLFDRYLIVDWSANSTPKFGKDSIWIALADAGGVQWVRNVPTRIAAMSLVRDVALESVASGKRLFAGFDFAFGWPKDALAQIAKNDMASWEALWKYLATHVKDDETNANNTYELAACLNRDIFSGDGPFWGHPHQHGGRYEGLAPTKPHAMNVPEFRHVESYAKGSKSVWQLAYNGAVGRQSMLGMAHLNRLRFDERLKDAVAIWPFETGFAERLEKAVTIAEIYPSLFAVDDNEGEVRDEAQVRTIAANFADFDSAGEFHALLARPDALDDETTANVLQQEGWIVGAGRAIAAPSNARQHAPELSHADYIRDPAAIYAASFATIEREVDLSTYSPAMAKIATRLIHSCGMVDVVDDLAFSPAAAETGISALAKGCTVYCDVEMVKSGIIGRNLPDGCDLVCTLNDPRAAAHGVETRTTRSAAAVDFWDRLQGAICVIGNAPTALFRLLERIDEGAGKPALIIGIPVGFVGAVESKQALAENPRGCDFITVHGRRGGSAMASSVVNALAFMAGGKS